MDIDLTTLPSDLRYEDRYQHYMDVFKQIAHAEDTAIDVIHPPHSWVPLLYHLNCNVINPRSVFEHCHFVRGLYLEQRAQDDFDRTLVEVLCGFRPETVDALWKCDMQWKLSDARRHNYYPRKEFIVTSNGAFHRQEVQHYLALLESYRPRKQKVLLVPCAADKPYPSPMHKLCLDMMPSDFYMMNVTGVLGLVPQDLWNCMPHYDSGIPNRWRVFKAISKYFNAHPHDKIVVYCDFYSEAIKHGLSSIGVSARFVLPVREYDDYVDLVRSDLLVKLHSALHV